MIIVDLVDYDNSNRFITYKKIKSLATDVDLMFFLTNDIRNESLRNKEECVFVPYEIEKNMLNNYEHQVELAKAKRFQIIDELIPFYENIIVQMKAYNNIEVVYCYNANPTLEMVCDKYNIYTQNIEGSAFRETEYYNFELAWLTDRNRWNARNEGDYRYKKFLEQKEKLVIDTPISASSLLLIGAKDNKLISLVQAMTQTNQYELGVALPWEGGYYQWTANGILRMVEKKYDLADVLVRPYPTQPMTNIINEDKSSSVLDFIGKCKCILTVASNVSFEAMMMGKKVIELSDVFYASHVYNSIDELSDSPIYDDWYINFLYFGMFVHWNRLFDSEYIGWRKTNPTEAEIFNDNYNYIFTKLIKTKYTYSELRDWKKVLAIRSSTITFGDSANWEFANKIIVRNWKEEKNIYVYGIGRKALIVKESIEKLGGEIAGFIVSHSEGKNEYAGKPVYELEDELVDEQGAFVVSASVISSKIEIYMKLMEKGCKKIIV